MHIFSDKESALLILTGCIVLLGVTLAVFISGSYKSAHAETSWECSYDYLGSSQKQYILGDSNNNPNAYILVNSGTDVSNPQDMYSTLSAGSAYVSPLPENDWPTYTKLSISGASDADSWRIVPEVGNEEFGSGDFGNKSLTLADSGYPNSNIDTLTVFYPDPPSSPLPGDTWSFSYTITGGMTTDSPTYTPTPQTKEWNVEINCEVENSPPTAVDDGNNDASICNSGSTQNIYVLDNDTDPDGDDLEVESVENPTDLGGTATVGGDSTYVQYTPPSNETGTDTFDYTAKDTNGNTGSATVSVNVGAEDCGDISVSFQDDNGNSVSVDDAFVDYNDDELFGSGNGFSHDVDLYDDGRDALIEENFITPPEGYRLPDFGWADKNEAVKTYDAQNKSELGF